MQKFSEFLFEGAARVLAVWISASRWISNNSNWALLILLTLVVFGVWSKFR